MPTSPVPRSALLALASILAAQGQSPGQPPVEACKPGEFTVVGHPDEFGPKAGAAFDVFIDRRFEGEFLTREKIWLPVIEGALDKWSGVAGSKWRFHQVGLTDNDPDPADNKLTIAACGYTFGCPEGPPPAFPGGPGGDVIDFYVAHQTTLAVALIWEDNSPNRRIRNSDIFFNPSIPFSTEPGGGHIDFESVLLHELGHALGLDHNDNCGAGTTLMKSTIDLGQRRRNLSSSEIEGARFLYPEDNAPAVRVFDRDRQLRFDARRGGFRPFDRPVALYGLRFHRWQATANAAWLRLEPPSGRFQPDGTLRIGVDQAGLAAGTYQGTVSVRDLDMPGPPVAIGVQLVVGEGQIEERLPELTAAGVVNGANLRSGRIAPGSLVTIFGRNLATTTASAQSFPLPFQLGGTEVVFNGIRAALLYVSPGQINLLAPADTYSGRGGVIVRTSFGQNRGEPIDVLPTAPELFVAGERSAIALNQDGSLNSRENPAAVGEVVTVFLTGQGPTEPYSPSERPAPSDPPARVVSNRSAQVAGRDAKLHFLGLTPGYSGVAQANIEIPPGLTGELAVRVEIDGRWSNAAFLWVR